MEVKNKKHDQVLNAHNGPDIVIHYLYFFFFFLQKSCKVGIIRPVLKIRKLGFRAVKCLSLGLISKTVILNVIPQCLKNRA